MDSTASKWRYSQLYFWLCSFFPCSWTQRMDNGQLYVRHLPQQRRIQTRSITVTNIPNTTVTSSRNVTPMISKNMRMIASNRRWKKCTILQHWKFVNFKLKNIYFITCNFFFITVGTHYLLFVVCGYIYIPKMYNQTSISFLAFT